jgi:hypothetical protein
VATGAPTVGSPAISGPGNLLADSLSTGAPTVGAPQIWQVHSLAADGIATGAPSLGSPVLPGAGGKNDPGDWTYSNKNRKRLIKLAQLRELVAKEEKEIEFLIANGYL